MMMDNINVTLIDVNGGKYRGATNTRDLKDVYFSIKNRKFIKPVSRLGNRVEGHHIYKLLEGRYVIFDYDYWNKRDPMIVVEISLVRLINSVENGYTIEKIKSVKVKVNQKVKVIETIVDKGFSKLRNILEDFLNTVPGYHSGIDLKSLSTKVYEDDVITELLDFLDKYNGDTLFHQIEVD